MGQPGDRVLRVGEEHHGVIGDGNVLQFHPRRLRLGLQLLRGQGGGEEGVHLPVDEPLVGLMALGVALRELRMVVIIPEERPVYSPGVGVGGGGAVDDGHSFVKAPVDGGLGYQGRRVRSSSRKVIASPRVAGLSHSASSSTPGSP